MIKGQPVFDGLALIEVELNFSPAFSVRASAAFVNTSSGMTHGQTNAPSSFPWSQTVREKALELRAAIENDLAKRHLQEVEGGSDAPSLGLGIAENLQDEDGKPQI